VGIVVGFEPLTDPSMCNNYPPVEKRMTIPKNVNVTIVKELLDFTSLFRTKNKIRKV
jgi:hypothetical protein